MTSPIPSPKRPERKESHPYPIKTTSTGILARSNSSRAHNSLQRHRYVPATPSPSAKMIFDPPTASPGSPTRRTPVSASSAKVARSSPSNKSQVAQSVGSNSPSPSKYSKTWIAYGVDGEEVQLPRHPFLWTPSQLVTYLRTSLRNSEGEPLEEAELEHLLSFIQEQQIGGRAFLSLEEEDFQELDGINWDARNALWDAACTLRQQALPYRASRVSSTSYKRGRVKGMVDVFERSASESSDAGEDSRPVTRTSTPKRPNGVNHRSNGNASDTNHAGGRANGFWDLSESEDDAEKIVWGFGRQGKPPHQQVEHTSEEENPLVYKKVEIPNEERHDILTPREHEKQMDEVTAVASEPEQGSPEFPDTELPEDDGETPHNSRREIDIVSLPPQHNDEPSMAELYEQTYGEPAPSSRTVPVDIPHTGDTTLRVPLPPLPSSPEAEDSSQPPTVLRPVRAREISEQVAQSNPSALRDIFIAEPPEQLRNIFLVPQERPPAPVVPVQRLPSDSTDQEEILTLRARLEAVEKKLAELEKPDSKRATVEIPKPEVEARIREELQAAAAMPVVQHTPPRTKRRKPPKKSTVDDLDDLYKEFEERSALSRPMRAVHDMILGEDEFGTTLKPWQHSKYILLAGATTGISIVLVPLLLRHWWTR